MATEQTDNPRSHSDYTIGWVCALAKEQTAATAMLDVEHEDDLPIPQDDYNTYTRGSIGKHNVVIACLPEGNIGTNAAATVVKEMLRTFPSIRFGLMVGIGGGIPNILDHDVRLGDVVVSVPQDTYGGVVQWDLGKAEQEGFRRTGSLNHPPNLLLSAVSKLRTHHEMRGPRIPAYLDQMAKKWPLLAPKYLRSPTLKDTLFEPDYIHKAHPAKIDCQVCDITKALIRNPVERNMKIHYGLIASGNQVIKNARIRDELNDKLGGNVLCIEMEAAGLMHNFPCLIIRGICDYADSHKNKRWQEHAAAVAAAYAKELLEEVQPAAVNRERAARDIPELKNTLSKVCGLVNTTATAVNGIRTTIDSNERQNEKSRVLDWLTDIDFGPQHSLHRDKQLPGTGKWFLDSAEYQTWRDKDVGVLFCQGIQGAGKTILSSIVIEDLASVSRSLACGTEVAYIYCDYKRQDEQTALELLSSLTKQLCLSMESLPPGVRALHKKHASKCTRPSRQEMTQVLGEVIQGFTRVYVVVDALDELLDDDDHRNALVDELDNLGRSSPNLKIFVTSRPLLADISQFFYDASKVDIFANQDDVGAYVEGRLSKMPFSSPLHTNRVLQQEVKEIISQVVRGMFLLAQLYMDSLRDKCTPKEVRNVLRGMQHQNNTSNGLSVEERLYKAYDETMARINKQKPDFQNLATQILLWITHAKRPLSTEELRHALAVEVGRNELDEDNLIASLDVSICAGLAIVDDKSQEVRLVHYTTQEYLEQCYFKLSLNINPHNTITEVCVTYLMYSIFKSGPCKSKGDDYIGRIRTHLLYFYAATYWRHHARLCSEPSKLLLEFRNQDRSQGRWEEAEKLDMQVMETRKVKLGADHPSTLTSMGNLASTFWNQGRWEEAEKLEVQVMETSKAKLGADHPDTLTSMANLASTYRSQGRWEEAEKLEVQVMEMSKAKLGADHPSTLTSIANLALTYKNQGRWGEAEKLEVQVMETRKAKLGADHPSTLTSMANLAFT
ncbi:hypothetical protein QBC45DRAFT_480219 [Copromyces sp. CBS 386.78]|nr:hypothetical protein QBC45DRAFT_480219 [Copromyces sp. CBS 386.78]